MENTYTSSMGFLLLQEVQFLESKDDALLQWEFVNVLDVEEGAEKDADGDSFQNGFGSWDSSISWSISPNSDPIEGVNDLFFLPDDLYVKDHHHVDDHSNGDRPFDDAGDENGGCQVGDGDADGYGGGQVDDENEDDYNGYDLDDELVPWSVGSKFGRQRMRKLGKRAFPKMHNSKRSPYLFVKPGCVHGKHGLGLKHKY